MTNPAWMVLWTPSCSMVTVQRSSSSEKSAATTRWPYRMFLSMPFSTAASLM